MGLLAAKGAVEGGNVDVKTFILLGENNMVKWGI